MQVDEGLIPRNPIVRPPLDNDQDKEDQQRCVVHDGAQAELGKETLGGAGALGTDCDTPGVLRGMGHVVKNHATEEERQQRLMPRTRQWYVMFLFLVGGRAPPPPPPLLGRRDQ